METFFHEQTFQIGKFRQSVNETLSAFFDGQRKIPVTIRQSAGEYSLQAVCNNAVISIQVQMIGGKE